MRLARIGSWLRRNALPDTKTEAIFSLMPLGYSVYDGFMAPGEGFNAPVAAESALLELGSTFGGLALGRFAGSRLFPNDPKAAGIARTATEFMTGMGVNALAPRPAINAAFEKAALEDAQAQEQLLAQQDERELQQQLAAAMLGTGALAASGFSVSPGINLNAVV